MSVLDQIAEYLKIDAASAAKIRDYIDENDLLDWSEATQAEVRAAYREAYNETVSVR